MESSLHSIAAWTFISECSIPQDALDLMVPGEEPIIAYKTFRDAAIFTTKRLIVRDSQGLSGKKVEMYSLPIALLTCGHRRTLGVYSILTLNLNCGPEQATSRLKLGEAPIFVNLIGLSVRAF